MLFPLKMVKAKLNDTRYYLPETIDTKPQATVLSLGAVKFNPLTDGESYDEMYFKISVDDPRSTRTDSK